MDDFDKNMQKKHGPWLTVLTSTMVKTAEEDLAEYHWLLDRITQIMVRTTHHAKWNHDGDRQVKDQMN